MLTIMRHSNRFFASAASFAAAVAMMLPSATLAATNAPSAVFSPGDLIKGKSTSGVYYYASNGKRFVFPNEKTYFTWFKDFSGVKTISDAQLGVLPLGGNVTYRPGVKMLKITTDPRTYVVDQGGILRHVGSESLANTLYGLNWQDKIEDLPDPFFTNYKLGTAIQTASDYKPADVTTLTATIAQDKQFDETSVTVSIGDMATVGFVPTTLTIKKGSQITWTNRDVTDHTVTGNGWTSGSLKAGESYTRRFDTAGSFDYHCDIHTVMQGTVNVVN
jgi:plastocyanin